MSNSSKTLKPSEVPDLERAAEMARRMDYLAWVQWMRLNFSYSLAVRMSTFVGVKLPSHGFYKRVKTFSREVVA